MSDYVVIECPECGEASRSAVLATAYQGGWCVGSLDPLDSHHHKPKAYQVVDRVAKLPGRPAKTPACASCGDLLPKRQGPGRYPKNCESCKAVAA
jgi:predicted RNA-binding Zn-ribbon protein involved in translation (DUF1610 family)